MIASIEHSTRRFLWAGIFASAVWITADCGYAQVARYQPQRPTVSPYLNLTRLNNGGVPNYYSLVRPQLQQQDFNARTETLQRQQTGQLLQLERSAQSSIVGSTPAAPTGTASWFMTPSTTSTFRDTSGYYPQPRLPRQSQPRLAPQRPTSLSGQSSPSIIGLGR